MFYKLIVVTADERGRLTGYTINAERYREIKAVLDEATTCADDFDTDEDYEEFIAESGCIFGEVEAIDEDGTRYWDYAPAFSAENYAGHALYEGGELTELAAGACDTRYFLEKYYEVNSNETGSET